MVSQMALLAFIGLVAQNSSSTILTKMTRMDSKASYAPTAVICCTEIFKLVLSFLLEVRSRAIAVRGKEERVNAFSLKHVRGPINELVYTRRIETIQMAFPALCYAIVNGCSYAGIKLLDLPTYIITWQLKILTAALFGRILYGREVSPKKWFSLLILVVGVSLVQLQPSDKPSSPRATQDYVLGILIVIAGSLCSGLAGAFLENALSSKTSPSIYLRNVQICFPGFLFTLASFALNSHDLQMVKENGFFHGFTLSVLCMIGLHGFGGMLVSFLVKHLGVVGKGFASSLAIVITNLISIYVFPGSISSPAQVWLGSLLVVGSTALFARA